MKKLSSYFILIVSFSSFLIPIALYSQSSGYKVVGSIDIGGGSRWDYISVEPKNHRLYVAHASEVNVIDLDKDTLLGTIPNLQGVHGIAFAEEFGKGYISNGKNNSVTVFDFNSLKVLDSIKVTGNGPDAIAYDPFTKRIFTFNGHGGNATAIDAQTNKVIGTVTLEGSPEFAASGGDGKMYCNLENKSAIQVFDPQSLKIIANWPISPGDSPSGLAYDPVHKILFSGCHNQMMAIVSAESGKVITTVPIGKGIDACGFDLQDGYAFSSNGEGTITVVKENSPEDFKVFGNVATIKGARTMAVDEASHRLYTVTMLEKKDGTKSFGVLILAK